MDVKKFYTGNIPTNTYIVSDTGEAAIVDPAGFDEKIRAYIDDDKLKVKYVLLTHAHADHFYAAEKVCSYYNVEAYLGEKDFVLLNDNVNNAALLLRLSDCTPPKEITGLKQGDTLRLGNITLSFIEAPGHTGGGGAYYTPGALFDGDTLMNGSVGRSDFATGDFDALINTIKTKFYTLPDETVVYCGHSARTTIGHEKQYNPFVKGD